MSSSRKRKAADGDSAAAQPPSNTAAAGPRNEQPLVPATHAILNELRRRFRSVVEETAAKKLAGKASSSESGAAAESRSKDGGGAETATAAAPPVEDPATAAYLRAFQAAVTRNVQAMCELPDPRELQEEDQLVADMSKFADDVQAARASLAATRARVIRLSADTCRDALRVGKAADDRACSVLEARAKHARREKEAGGTLPLAPAANGDSGAGDHGAPDDTEASVFSDMDPSVMEPKVSYLIGKLSELPGPLKSVLQEIPELTASLAVSVQNAEAVMEKSESRTEALLGKPPPTPLPTRKRRAGGVGAGRAAVAGEAGDERPEEVRSAAREARVEQARKEWEAGGVGVAGSFFN
eukprot:g9396.t1